jgi:acyl-coenzyme A thioesterase PaaI-like protein
LKKPAASKAELQRLLDSERFLRTWRFRVIKADGDSCAVALRNRAALERPGGIVNGPALIAAADVAMWLAIKARLGMAHDALTSDLNTVFLAPAKARTIYCTARILKAGTRRFFGTAECCDSAGRIFAHHTLTYVRVN